MWMPRRVGRMPMGERIGLAGISRSKRAGKWGGRNGQRRELLGKWGNEHKLIEQRRYGNGRQQRAAGL